VDEFGALAVFLGRRPRTRFSEGRGAVRLLVSRPRRYRSRIRVGTAFGPILGGSGLDRSLIRGAGFGILR
jgi:hypothetical protein